MAAICALMFNPMAVEILDDWFKLVYTIIFVVGVVYLCGFLLWMCFRPEKVVLPKKSKKAKVKTSQYLAD